MLGRVARRNYIVIWIGLYVATIQLLDRVTRHKRYYDWIVLLAATDLMLVSCIFLLPRGICFIRFCLCCYVYETYWLVLLFDHFIGIRLFSSFDLCLLLAHIYKGVSFDLKFATTLLRLIKILTKYIWPIVFILYFYTLCADFGDKRLCSSRMSIEDFSVPANNCHLVHGSLEFVFLFMYIQINDVFLLANSVKISNFTCSWLCYRILG